MTEQSTPTHVVTVTLSSINDGSNVRVEVKWDPDLEGADIEELGYLPASYQFVQEFILPCLEEAYLRSEFKELFDTPSPSNRMN